MEFIMNQPVALEETLHCEFKEVRGKQPVNTIRNTVDDWTLAIFRFFSVHRYAQGRIRPEIGAGRGFTMTCANYLDYACPCGGECLQMAKVEDEYVVAFLNSAGGRIYWGIRDSDRVVVGVWLQYRQRDELRKAISSKLTEIQPPISPTAYTVNLHEVHESIATHRPLPDLSVVEVVAPRVYSDDLYFTGGNEAFVKTVAGKKKLSGPELQDEISRRLQKKSGHKKPDDEPGLLGRLGFSAVLKRARMVAPALKAAEILWVDDNPGNNIYERMMLKSLGIIVDVAVSTDEALAMLSMRHYDAVISDMERHGNTQAGLKLLYGIQERGWRTQTVFYTGWIDPSRGTPPGAFGITVYPDELIHYVLDILERERIR